MQLKLTFLALFLIYVGLLDAVPYMEYSLSRRPEITKNSLIGIGGIRSLSRQKGDDDGEDMNIDNLNRSYVAAGVGALGAMMTAALELGNIFLGVLGGVLGGANGRSLGLHGDVAGDRVQNMNKLRNILESPRFRKALEVLDSEIKRHINTDHSDNEEYYDASH